MWGAPLEPEHRGEAEAGGLQVQATLSPVKEEGSGRQAEPRPRPIPARRGEANEDVSTPRESSW